MLIMMLVLIVRKIAAPRYDLSCCLTRKVYTDIQDFGCVNVCML